MGEARLIVYKAARGSAKLRAVLCIALTIGVKHDILIAGRDDALVRLRPSTMV